MQLVVFCNMNTFITKRREIFYYQNKIIDNKFVIYVQFQYKTPKYTSCMMIFKF